MAKEKSFDKLFAEFDNARAVAKNANDVKDELSTEIKQRLEAKKLEEVDAVDFICTYRYDKDRETEVFDEEKFAAKEPKKYQQYTELMEEMKAIILVEKRWME